MARQARKLLDSSIVSVTQRSRIPMFRNDQDRRALLNILRQAQEKFDYTCYAFCLLDDYAFHMILDTKGRRISTIVQSISVSYTRYRQIEGKLFTDRFKSKALKDEKELTAEIDHMKKQTAGHFNSYCLKDLNDNSVEGLRVELDIHLADHRMMEEQLSADEAQDQLSEWIREKGCDPMELRSDKVLRNQCIREFRRNHNLSLKVLGEVFGLTESSVSKIISSYEQNN